MYKDVFIDIINTCNAKCPFCITGINKPINKKYLAPDVFNNILKSLIKNQAINNHSLIHLYNWGEPLLHTNLSELVEIINKNNLLYGLSTNGSIEFNFPDYFYANLNYLKFSLPGFSEESYKKIHGFNFKKILINIEHIIHKVKKENSKTNIELNFHIYQFNLDEIKACSDFAKKLNVNFNPNNAILNHWDNLNLYLEKKLPYEELLDVSQKLLMYNFNDLLRESPVEYKCPQFDLLVIDENANVIGCCQLPKENKEYICGNILTDSWERILRNKISMPVCSNCLSKGLAYYINNSLISFDFINSNKIEKAATLDLFKLIIKRFKQKIFNE